MTNPTELITITRSELDAMTERFYKHGLETGMLIGSQNTQVDADHEAHVQNMRRYDSIFGMRCGCQMSGGRSVVYCGGHLPEMENEAAFIRNITGLAMSY